MARWFRACVWVSALAVVAGCASHPPAPAEERSPLAAPAPAPPPPVAAEAPAYTVKPGESLYRIAAEHHLDYHELAAWNGLKANSPLHPGQVLRLGPPAQGAQASAGVVTAPLRGAAPPAVSAGALALINPERSNSDTLKHSPRAVKLPYSQEAYNQLTHSAAAEAPAVPAAQALASAAPPAPPAQAADDRIDWSWPASGRVVGNFSETDNLKGIDIGGQMGQPIFASAAGKIVYADAGLRGYGKLIVIKHNKTYLSAYAHNSKLLVKEGQQVARGQKIAEMGNTDSDSVKLHFEIRLLGKPVDPLKYLPPT